MAKKRERRKYLEEERKEGGGEGDGVSLSVASAKSLKLPLVRIADEEGRGKKKRGLSGDRSATQIEKRRGRRDMKGGKRKKIKPTNVSSIK